MKKRLVPYTIILLVSLLVSLLPVAIYSDLISPVSKWHNSWPGRPASPQQYNLENPPTPLRIEHSVFKALVIPPAFVWYKLGGFPGYYAGQYIMGQGSSFDAPFLDPPYAQALDHLKMAIPFYGVFFIVVYELSAQLLRKLLKRRTVA